MNTVIKFFLAIILSTITIIDVDAWTINPRPVVKIDTTTDVNGDELVTLDGSRSYDRWGGHIVSYQWTQKSGSPIVTINNSDQPIASFTVPNVNTALEMTLKVTDNGGKSRSKSTTITVNKVITEPVNEIPVANAGVDLNVDETKTVILNGSVSRDSDGTISSYAWIQTSGPAAKLTNANQAAATFTAPDVDTDTQLNFQLTVTDNEDATATDSITVLVLDIPEPNQAPIAVTSNNFSTDENTLVTLDGSASTDPDGTISSYSWTQIASSPIVVINTPTSPNASFTTPGVTESTTMTFELMVTDDDGASATDSIKITVTETPVQTTSGCTKTISSNDSISDTLNTMNSGEVLCLNDGIYSQGLDVPSGITVKAVNRGNAEFVGGDASWSSILKMENVGSTIDGLKVHHPENVNSDACFIGGTNNTMRNTSCSHGGFYKSKIPLRVGGQGHLIEDSWFYGEGRYVVQCFKGENITFRRNVARWDSTAPNETSANATYSIDNCSDITIENNISLDYGIPETVSNYGGDFYSSQQSYTYPTGNQNNHWLGNIAINHAVATNNRRAIRFDVDTKSFNNVVRDFYVRGSGTAFVSNWNTLGLVVSDCTLIDVAEMGSIPGQSSISCGNGADIAHRYVDRVKTSELLFQ